MNQSRKPVKQYYYSEQEWTRLGCGPLPTERDLAQQPVNKHVKGNLKIDGKNIKGRN
jgi:hypothetical protein